MTHRHPVETLAPVSHTTHDEALAAQAARARWLVKHRRCPHCDEPISRIDALSMVRGHGYCVYVRIRLSDGSPWLIQETQFNPQTMLWSDPPASTA